jgi:hypothetical protein
LGPHPERDVVINLAGDKARLIVKTGRRGDVGLSPTTAISFDETFIKRTALIRSYLASSDLF